MADWKLIIWLLIRSHPTNMDDTLWRFFLEWYCFFALWKPAKRKAGVFSVGIQYRIILSFDRYFDTQVPIIRLTLFDVLAILYFSEPGNGAWDYSGREPEVSWQTMSVPVSLIGKGSKWRQRFSSFYGCSMWILSTKLRPSKIREWYALWPFDGWGLHELAQKPSGFFHS